MFSNIKMLFLEKKPIINNIRNNQKKYITNSTIIAIFLIFASHFIAPFLFDFFSFSLDEIHLSPNILYSFILPSFVESTPIGLVLFIIPHFIFGFHVEEVFGSLKYAIAILLSSSLTNIITFILCYLINFKFIVLPQKFPFATIFPLSLLCMNLYSLKCNPLHSISSLLLPAFLYGSIIFSIIRCFFSFYVYAIHCIVSICVNCGILIVLDPEEITYIDYVKSYLIHSSSNSEENLDLTPLKDIPLDPLPIKC